MYSEQTWHYQVSFTLPNEWHSQYWICWTTSLLNTRLCVQFCPRREIFIDFTGKIKVHLNKCYISLLWRPYKWLPIYYATTIMGFIYKINYLFLPIIIKKLKNISIMAVSFKLSLWKLRKSLFLDYWPPRLPGTCRFDLENLQLAAGIGRCKDNLASGDSRGFRILFWEGLTTVCEEGERLDNF